MKLLYSQIKDKHRQFFEEKVMKLGNESGCWMWIGSGINGRYGNFGLKVSGVLHQESTHRAAWMIHNKMDIPDGNIVCHKCDCAWCVNPAHLYIGTHKDNERDKRERNRHARGERHGSKTKPERIKRGADQHLAKLDDGRVRILREMESTCKISSKEIADLFGISRNTVYAIVNRRTWRHIP